MPFQSPSLVIGVSARIYYPAQNQIKLGGVWTKTLHYLEQSVAQWLMREGVLPVMIPAVDSQSLVKRSELNLSHYANALDALVLQGGNDVAPSSYGETPLNPAWSGDSVRDQYEMELIRAFVRAGKPVFGICRGLQLLNVAFGGTLWQDIKTQKEHALNHVDSTLYEKLVHDLEIVPGTRLATLYAEKQGLQQGELEGDIEGEKHVNRKKELKYKINSIHHQAIRDLAPDFVVEARCPNDGIIEAVRRKGPGFVAAVQWHPEFHGPGDTSTFDDKPMLHDFLQFVRNRKKA